MTKAADVGHRHELLNGLRRFVAAVQHMAGVRRIAVLGSIVTAKSNPKDIDVLVVVTDDADLAPLAAASRRLQGHAQGFNRGADVFLASEHGTYIGRTCRWRDCRPGVRQSCDALHCGQRQYLHDDLEAIRLNSTLVLAPPVTCGLKSSVESNCRRISKKLLRHSNTPSNIAMDLTRPGRSRVPVRAGHRDRYADKIKTIVGGMHRNNTNEDANSADASTGSFPRGAGYHLGTSLPW